MSNPYTARIHLARCTTLGRWFAVVATVSTSVVTAAAEPEGATPVPDGVAPGVAGSGNPPLAPVPVSLATPAKPLGEREAVERALRDNPTLRGIEVELLRTQEQIQAEQGRYPYSFLADAGVTRTESPQLRADDSVAASPSRVIDASVGLRRVFPFGTVAELRATEEYFNRDTNAVTVSPFLPATAGHGASVRATVTQPLLRGFGTRIGEAALAAARVDRVRAERALARVRSALARDVLVAYHELWYASRALEIEAAALGLAREQERQASERVLQGALSTSELLSFQTRSAEREEGVITARANQRQRSLVVSQLMGQLDAAPPLLAAGDPPAVGEVPADPLAFEQALATGSIELAELHEQVRLAEVRARAAGDTARPRLDATGYVQSSGISEEFPRAWQRAAGLDYWSAHVGVSLELPLDGTRERAERAEARLAVEAARAQLRAAQDRIAAEVASALDADRAARERMASAQHTLAIAERAHEAAQARYELGQTIAISLQQAEDDLRRARLRVIRARVDVAGQRLSVQHLTGRLLTATR